MFGRATIRLGIGPHSSSDLLSVQRQPVTDTAAATDTCSFNNSIDAARPLRATAELLVHTDDRA